MQSPTRKREPTLEKKRKQQNRGKVPNIKRHKWNCQGKTTWEAKRKKKNRKNKTEASKKIPCFQLTKTLAKGN